MNTLIPEGAEGSNSVNFFQRSPFSVIVLVLLSFFDSNDLYECGGAFLDFWTAKLFSFSNRFWISRSSSIVAFVIVQVAGGFRNPEELAFGRFNAPIVPLYRVRFKQQDVWPDYRGSPSDSLEVEIYEFWLKPISS